MSNIGAGLGGSVGFAAETTYATTVTPTTFIEVSKCDLAEKPVFTTSGGIAGGRTVGQTNRRVKQTTEATGSLSAEFPLAYISALLLANMGTVASSVTGTGTAAVRTDVYTLAPDILGKSLTFQVGEPQTDGTVVPFTFKGTKVTALELAQAKQDNLVLNLDLDSWGMDPTNPTLTAPTFPSVGTFTWADLAVTLGATTASLAAVDGISEGSVKVERKMATDRYYTTGIVSNVGRKKEPITNDIINLTGSLTADMVLYSDLVGRFIAGSLFSARYKWTSPLIIGTSSTAYSLQVDLPSCYFTDGTIALDGNDILNGSFPFQVGSDGTNAPITITHVTANL